MSDRAERLRALRKRTGWSLQQVAERAEVSARTVWRAEHGHNVTVGSLDAIDGVYREWARDQAEFLAGLDAADSETVPSP